MGKVKPVLSDLPQIACRPSPPRPPSRGPTTLSRKNCQTKPYRPSPGICRSSCLSPFFVIVAKQSPANLPREATKQSSYHPLLSELPTKPCRPSPLSCRALPLRPFLRGDVERSSFLWRTMSGWGRSLGYLVKVGGIYGEGPKKSPGPSPVKIG